MSERIWHPLPYAKDTGINVLGMPIVSDMINKCLDVWAAKLSRNQLKYRYYDGKNVLKDFGISIPPQLLDVETVVGWPQKAVDALAVRSRFDGFTASDPVVQRMLDEFAEGSQLKRQWKLAAQSTLIHSCTFPTFGVGEDGMPRMDIHSAESAAAIWDFSRGCIAYGIAITEFDEGRPSKIDLFVDDLVCHTWDTGNYWECSIEEYDLGRGAMETFVYRPTHRKPFGQSRISRAVMSITDSAVREALRTEISAEFFTSPQKYLLGADAKTFNPKTKWEAYIGNIFAVTRDANGDLPQFGQLPQGTMQPHTEYMRSLAARFSGETNVPMSTLGIVHDNPASAQAIYAASEPLIIECEDFNENARYTFKNLGLLAIATMLDKRVDELTETERDFTVNFKNPAMPSIVSQADAMVKIAAAVPDFAGTDTFFEQMGFAEDTRRKVANEMQRNAGSFVLSQVMGNGS